MFGLKVFSHKPREFNYKPRFYDPEKEAREERRRELLGDAAYTEEELKDMKPGMYIRENMRMRRGYASKHTKERRERVMRRGMILLVILVVLLIWILN